MSARDVRQILLRAQTDDEFFQRFRNNPDNAFAEYALEPEEREALARGDQSLYRYLMPAVSTNPEEGAEFTITITGQHDWFNVVGLGGAEVLPAEVQQRVLHLSEQVLGAPGAERMEMLLTLLQLMDGRQQ